MNTEMIVLYVFAFVLCCSIAYFFIRMLRNNNALQRVTDNARKSFEETVSKASQRKKDEEDDFLKYGKKEDSNWMFELDMTLERSGLRKIFPFLVTEIYLFIVGITTVLVGGITEWITDSIIYMFAAMAVCVCVNYIVVFLLNVRTDKLIDGNLLQFADLLESYALTSDDLTDIFEKVYEYLDEPLRSIILDGVTNMKLNGDQKLAFQRMRIKAGNRKFGELLYNLEECSKNNADYASAVRGIHQTLEVQQTEKEDRRRMANGARINIAIMIGIYCVALNIINGFVGENVFTYLQETAMGKLILILIIAIFIYVTYKLITMGEK